MSKKADIIRTEEQYEYNVPMSSERKTELNNEIRELLYERFEAEESIRLAKEKLKLTGKLLEHKSSMLRKGIEEKEGTVKHHYFVKERDPRLATSNRY